GGDAAGHSAALERSTPGRRPGAACTARGPARRRRTLDTARRQLMRIRWYGQSAFLLEAEQSVFIDPFGAGIAGLAERGLRFDYPPIGDVRPDLLLVTHEHADHNGIDAIAGEPAVRRSTAGTLDSPLGEVVAIASEHDDVAGTQ